MLYTPETIVDVGEITHRGPKKIMGVSYWGDGIYVLNHWVSMDPMPANCLYSMDRDISGLLEKYQLS